MYKRCKRVVPALEEDAVSLYFPHILEQGKLYAKI